MTKAELIKALEPFDDDLPIIVYDSPSEDGGFARRVRLETAEDEDNLSYYKGDHPFSFHKNITRAIEISS